LKGNHHVKVILEKTAGFSGVLRTQETRWIAGEKRKDTVHRENDCSFYLDVDETYFSPRLSQDRKIMCEQVLKSIKKNARILVMFAGVSPLPIVLAKTLKRNKISAEIISSELNKKACEYGEKNVQMNKVSEYVKVFCGDSRKLCERLSKKRIKFDFIFMLRPNLEETFLDAALKVARKGTVIYYHGFSEGEEKVTEEILTDIKKAKRKISKLEIRKAGDISVRKNRYSVKFKVLS
jgi:tRNA (guanine37-N1)-methyltransferase